MMIRLTEDHREAMTEFLSKDSAANLFMLGDLENFGFDETKQEFYGRFIDHELCAVLMMYNQESLHFYTAMFDDQVVQQIRALISQHPTLKTMNITASVYDLYQASLAEFIVEARATKLSVFHPEKILDDDPRVERLGLADCQAVLDLEAQSFSGLRQSLEKMQQGVENGTRVMYGIHDQSGLASVATYTAMTDFNAMVIAVCTRDSARQRGYASAVVAKLSFDLLAKGRRGVLFYDNPAAARIYERLGYRYHTTYEMITLRNDCKL